MKVTASSVSEYLASLPAERRKELGAVRRVIKQHLPKGYVEALQYGMITYVVPLKTFPEGYLGKSVPLPYVSLGAQKNYLAVYLMNVYGNPELERWFRAAYAKSGKKLDMGKACLRFDKANDLALDVVGKAVAHTSVKAHIERYVAGRGTKRRSRVKARTNASRAGR
jgi:hypothetical protein